jgi:hypothetical protein
MAEVPSPLANVENRSQRLADLLNGTVEVTDDNEFSKHHYDL